MERIVTAKGVVDVGGVSSFLDTIVVHRAAFSRSHTFFDSKQPLFSPCPLISIYLPFLSICIVSFIILHSVVAAQCSFLARERFRAFLDKKAPSPILIRAAARLLPNLDRPSQSPRPPLRRDKATQCDYRPRTSSTRTSKDSDRRRGEAD